MKNQLIIDTPAGSGFGVGAIQPPLAALDATFVDQSYPQLPFVVASPGNAAQIDDA
jgi:hypothetical protein